MMMKQYDWNILVNMMIMRKYDMIIWMKICLSPCVMMMKKYDCNILMNMMIRNININIDGDEKVTELLL